MTDTPDTSRLLASAALDNEVTADERAQVDASESLTAEVATYRALRRDLAEVDVPSDVREAGIAAALAAFDAMMLDVNLIDAHPTDEETRSNVVSMQARRRRQFRWLGGVAAAAIVAVLGIVVVNANSSNGKNLSSTAEPAPRVTSASPNETSSDQSGKQPDATSAADSANGGAQSNPAAIPGNGTAEAGGAVVATAAIAPSAGPAASAGVGIDPWADAPSFDGAVALAAFALAPGSPLSATADSGTRTSASAPTSGHSSSGSTASSTGSSTAASTAGATATIPVLAAIVTTTSTFAASATTAAAATSAATTAAGAATPAPLPVGSIVMERADAVCNTGGHPTIAAIYIGRRVIIVRDDATSQLQILDPQTCAITSAIAVS